jgi:hypothetical protein
MNNLHRSDLQAASDSEKYWIVTANMGYGHLRATYPLRKYAEDRIIIDGFEIDVSPKERKRWKRILNIYESFSRAKGIPFIGNYLFNLLDAFLQIPSYYPIRDLSNSTFQVNYLRSNISKGLCSGMLDKVRTKNIPVIASFYASAVAVDLRSFQSVFCIICDADINRVWVAKDPYESRIEYFAPCDKAAQRLRTYGVPTDRIYTTGFPLPEELLGGRELPVLKKNLRKRLAHLDPSERFKTLHGKNVQYFLGNETYTPSTEDRLTIMYAVGGAGAQKEIGGKIANSLKDDIRGNTVRLILVAGTRKEVRDYFEKVKSDVAPGADGITVIYSEDITTYFDLFNAALANTDILWTKPSELSFYCALGLPIIMTPPIGSQEKFNAKWLYEIQAGIRQENPDYTHEWLFEKLNKGVIAEAAWSGFLKARKLGLYKILDVIRTGKITQDHSPLLR